MAKARARSEAPAPRRPPQKSQGSPVLIIFLVFFILIGLTLGIFLYLAQDKIAQAETTAKAATQKSTETSRINDDLNQYYSIAFRDVIDPGTVTADERTNLATLERNIQQATGSVMPNKEFIAARQTAEGILGGKPNPDVAATFFKGLVKQLQDRLAESDKNRVKAESDYKDEKAKYEAYQKDWNRDKYDAEWKVAAAKLLADNQQKLDEKQRALDKAIADIRAVENQMQQLITDEKTKHVAELKARQAQVDDKVAEIEKFRQEQIAKSELAKTIVIGPDSPKVFRVEPNSDVVYIDIGTGDRVPPDLTFNVYRRGPGGKPDLTPIASIRVINIVGKGVSAARITRVAKPEFSRNLKTGAAATPDDPEYWITDPRDFYKTRSPVMPGDLLNNPAYRRNDVIHVFLSGVFDLDGDGHDDIDTFRRMLREMGAEVDGYLDPTNDHEIKGRIDYMTDYLILGNDSAVGGKGGLKLKENAAKVEAEARKKGLRIERLNSFLTQMGFTDVRVPSLRGVNGGAAAPAPAANGAKKDDAPKKDDEKPKNPAKEEGDEEKKKK